MYHAIITVTLRPSILDPEGKAIEHALQSLAMREVSQVRVGKRIEMEVDAPDREQARAIVDEACRKLLANPGDAILVPRPSYPLFDFLAGLNDLELIPYPLSYHDGWRIGLRSGQPTGLSVQPSSCRVCCSLVSVFTAI